MSTRIRTGRNSARETRPTDVNWGLAAIVVVCLLPYISLGPLSVPSQVQPWGGLLAWCWVIAKSTRSGVRITLFQGALLIFAFFFMVNVYGGEGFDLAVYLRRSGSYLLSAGIFLALQYLNPATLWKSLRITIPLWLAFGILRNVSSTAYFAIVTPLIPTVVVSDQRGTSSLAPEATDFGFLMAFVVALCLITRQRLAEEGIHTEKWPLICAVLSVLISLSGMGYLGLAAVGVAYVLTGPVGRSGRIGRILLAATITGAAVTFMSLLPTQSVRGLELMRLSIQDPIELMDTTTSYRIVHGVVGFLGLLDSGFWGFGAGSFQAEALAVYFRHDLGEVFGLTGHYAENVPASLTSTPSSQIAIILLEFGVFGLVYLLLIFGFATRSSIPLKSVGLTVLVLAWFGSFPASWPPFWVLLGVMMSPHFVSLKSHSGTMEASGASPPRHDPAYALRGVAGSNAQGKHARALRGESAWWSPSPKPNNSMTLRKKSKKTLGRHK